MVHSDNLKLRALKNDFVSFYHLLSASPTIEHQPAKACQLSIGKILITQNIKMLLRPTRTVLYYVCIFEIIYILLVLEPMSVLVIFVLFCYKTRRPLFIFFTL